ncbi:hypothetical protein N219_11400 [Limosilactobacillus fermentum MTCC 8711]|nr:hypothetical protein N219_11400 [Limosilactobacillus fermentum MTCC 8711]
MIPLCFDLELSIGAEPRNENYFKGKLVCILSMLKRKKEPPFMETLRK